MADGGEAVSRALALMDQFYLSMMESGVLKILAFQYECFAEITEETYLKFLENFSNLSTAVKGLNDEIFVTDRRDAACQTAKVSIQGYFPQLEEPIVQNKPLKVQKVKIIENVLPAIQQPAVKPTKSRVSVKRDPMVCDYCEQKFTTLENFEVHIRQIHGEQFSRSFFSCQICTQHYLSSEALYEHIACAHNLNEEDEETGDQLCAYCAELVSSWQELENHLVSVHDVYMCKTCHVMCETQQSLEFHVKSAHLTGIKPELMEDIPPPPKPMGRPLVSDTNKSSTPIQPLVNESPTRKRGRPRKVPILDIDIKEIICSICNSRFPTEETLKKHIIFKHEPATKELTCKKCNLKFRRRTALENHMRIVHNALELSDGEEDDKSLLEFVTGVIEEPSNVTDPINMTESLDLIEPKVTDLPAVEVTPPVQVQVKSVPKTTPVPRATRIHCKVCGEMCSKQEDEEIHKDHHATRNKHKFLCLYCIAPAMTQHELRTHIVSEHRYRCPFCGLTFWWKGNLDGHLVQYHNSKSQCPKCGVIEQGDALRLHILQAHLPKKLYLCKECGTEHITVREMHEHEMTHSKWQNSMMSCDICHRTFGTRHSLKGHMLRHLHGSFCCYLCGQQCHSQQKLQAHLTRHKKSQFACFCGQRFAKKTNLQAHQRSNVCKQGIATGPKADIFVEVCVPAEEDDVINEGITLGNAAKMQRLVGEQADSNVWQINIALPDETPVQLSRDFLSSLAHSVNSEVGADSSLLAPGRQPILILDANSEDTEATLIEDQPSEIVQWLQNQRPTVSTSDLCENE